MAAQIISAEAFVALSCILISGLTSGTDEFCLEKARQGGVAGELYKIEEACKKCACDGNMKMFCIKDRECERNKEMESSQPCYRDGVRHSHGSQVQYDCNVCTCDNTEWTCTTQDCGRKQGPSLMCEDKHASCAKWARRPSRCETNRFMKKNCHLSCKTCTIDDRNEEVTVNDENRADEYEHAADEIEEWKKRLQEQGLIRQHESQVIGCQFDCGGKIYPWGSQLQTRDCGLCECKRRARADYFFQCSGECPVCNN